MPDLFFDQQKSLGFMTITANRMLCVFLRRKLAEAGIDLTAEQWGLLALLWNRGGMSQDELAQIACVDKSSMSRMLAGMERKGLILRRADPADARRKIINATEPARRMKERCRDVVQEVLEQAMRDVSPQDRAVCLNALDTVKKTLREMGN